MNFGQVDRLPICEICTPDFMTFAEDMSYNHGPMISKELFDEFIAPYYKKIVPKLKENNIITFIDTDGDIEDLIPWFLEVGVEGFLPFMQQGGYIPAVDHQTPPGVSLNNYKIYLKLLDEYCKKAVHK